jgi:hypothetical protein
LLIGGLLLTGCNKTVDNPEIIENDCSIDGSCLVEVEESKNAFQTPSFEELNNIVDKCDDDSYDYNVYQKSYILPYKD